jgi:hypothetical protein
MYNLGGGCHCGNIVVKATLGRAPTPYNPRACDCTFCIKHGAAYVSDAQGLLSIEINSERDIRSYRQGSGLAECLFCACCGVLVGVVYRSEEGIYAAVNAKAMDAQGGFGEPLTASPKALADSDKIKRWRDLWFPNVTFSHGKT